MGRVRAEDELQEFPHPQPSSGQDRGVAAHPALAANPQALLRNRVGSGDGRSLCRAEMRLCRKD